MLIIGYIVFIFFFFLTKHNQIVGLLQEDTDPLVNVMKVDNAPLESYADIGGLEQQIMEIKVCTLIFLDSFCFQPC